MPSATAHKEVVNFAKPIVGGVSRRRLHVENAEKSATGVASYKIFTTSSCACYVKLCLPPTSTSKTSWPRSIGPPTPTGERPAGKAAPSCSPPELADEVMVTGDVHGHRRNFDRIRRIAALDGHPRRHLVLQEVCHGGPSYPHDAGCMSHTILEDVAALKAKYPERVHFILGNHELAELSDYPIQKNRQLLNLLFRQGLQQMYGPAAEEVRQAILRFLVELSAGGPAAAGSVHLAQLARGRRPSGIRPVGPRPRARGRGLFRASGRFPAGVGPRLPPRERPGVCRTGRGQVLITGHEPCREGFVAPNDLQIILDCCGDKAAYVILPVGVELSHAEILERVRTLEEG